MDDRLMSERRKKAPLNVRDADGFTPGELRAQEFSKMAAVQFAGGFSAGSGKSRTEKSK